MVFLINGCAIDTGAYEVRRGGSIVPVEPQVFDLLVLLLQNRARVVTKDEIFERIWHGRAVSEAALSSRIKSLRQAIGDTGASQSLVRTIRGRGFRVVGAVREIADGAEPAVEPGGDVAAAPEDARAPGGVGARIARLGAGLMQGWRGRVAIGLVAALMPASLAGWVVLPAGPAPPAAIPSTALGMPKGPGIAVLPFVHVSVDDDSRFPADAIVEEIATNLTRFSELRVAARGLASEYEGAEIDFAEVGRRLGVDFLVKGSVRRASERLRASAQLLRASDGALLWAETYERPYTPADMFAIHEDIASKVVAATASIAGGAIARETLVQGRSSPPRALSAYACIVRANEVMSSGFSAATHLATRSCLETAVAREPDYAAAWALLAWVHTIEYAYGHNRRADSDPRERALAAARRAVELAPTNPLARFAMARAAYIMLDLQLFHAEASAALDLNPHDPLLLGNLGNWLAFSGRWDEGVALVRKAIALNPKGYPRWWHAALGKDHYRKRAFAEALAEFKTMNLPGWWWNQVELAYTYGQLGDRENARNATARLLALYPGFDLEKAVIEHRKFSFEPSYIELAVDGLRKAGVPERTEIARP